MTEQGDKDDLLDALYELGKCAGSRVFRRAARWKPHKCMAAQRHAPRRKLYDRSSYELTLDEVERRIALRLQLPVTRFG